MQIRINYFVVLFFIAVSTVNAQTGQVPGKSWTLEECIDYALKNNIQIRQTELNSEMSESYVLQSQGSFLPSLNANASHSYNIGRTIDRYTNTFANSQVLSQQFGLSAELNLFSGFQNVNTLKQNRYNYLASKFDVDKMRNDVSLNIASAYLQVLYSMDAVEIAANQMGLTTKQVERTGKLVDAGSTAKGTLLDIQAQLASEELNLTTAQNQRDIALLSLAQLLNLPTAEGFTVVRPDLGVVNDALLTATPSQIYNTAVANLPEVKSAEYKVKGADKGVSVARGALSPRLTFNGFIGTGYSGASQRITGDPSVSGFAPDGSFTSGGDTVYSPVFSVPGYENIPYFDQYRDNVNKSFGFYLTVPIFNRFQTKTAIDRAKIQKLSAELTVESTKLEIQKTVQQAYADANAGLKKYYSSLKALEATQQSFSYTEQKFNLGALNTNDYNISKNLVAKAQSDLLQAKYEYVFKTKVLDFYQGKPLKL